MFLVLTGWTGVNVDRRLSCYRADGALVTRSPCGRISRAQPGVRRRCRMAHDSQREDQAMPEPEGDALPMEKKVDVQPGEKDRSVVSGPVEPHQVPSTSVDWSVEWNRFLQAGGAQSQRLPKDRRVPTEPEKVIARARNSLQRATSEWPTREQLVRDWRFWVAVLLTLSLATAAISNQGDTSSVTSYPSMRV